MPFSTDTVQNLHRPPDPPLPWIFASWIARAWCRRYGLSIARPMLLLYCAALDAFAKGPWGAKYPAIARRAGAAIGSSRIPILRFPRRRAANYLHHKCHRGA